MVITVHLAVINCIYIFSPNGFPLKVQGAKIINIIYDTTLLLIGKHESCDMPFRTGATRKRNDLHPLVCYLCT